MDFDIEDKIVAKRREKSKKHKNKNKENLLSHDPVPKNIDKKRNMKMKKNMLEPGQRTLGGFGFVRKPVVTEEMGQSPVRWVATVMKSLKPKWKIILFIC